jgi:hypothetical protein
LVKTELKKFGVTNGTKFGEGEIIGKTQKKREKDNRPCPYKKTTLKPYLEVSERLLHPRPLPRAATAGFRKFSSGRRQSGLPNWSTGKPRLSVGLPVIWAGIQWREADKHLKLAPICLIFRLIRFAAAH